MVRAGASLASCAALGCHLQHSKLRATPSHELLLATECPMPSPGSLPCYGRRAHAYACGLSVNCDVFRFHIQLWWQMFCEPTARRVLTAWSPTLARALSRMQLARCSRGSRRKRGECVHDGVAERCCVRGRALLRLVRSTTAGVRSTPMRGMPSRADDRLWRKNNSLLSF